MNRLIAILLLLIFCVPGSYAEVRDANDIIFTGCPPYVEGNHCDSIFYQVVAVDQETGEKCPEVRYFLVEGPGTIDEETGLWVYHPNSDDLSEYTIEIGATVHGDSTSGDQNCRFVAYVTNNWPLSTVISGTHYTVLPFDSVLIPIEPYDTDPCDEVSVTWQVTPEPSGTMTYDDSTGIVKFTPGYLDAEKTFELYLQLSSGAGQSGHYRLYFDVFLRDPIVVSLETIRNALPGDTVEVDVVLEACPVELGRMTFGLEYDSDMLKRVSARSGEALFSDTNGCGWQQFDAVWTGSCIDSTGPGGIRLQLSAYRSVYDSQPTCFVPNSLPAVIATLRFEVQDVGDVSEAFSPVRFYWCDCESNVLRSPRPDTLDIRYYPWAVYDHNGQPVTPEGIPGSTGATRECWPDAKLRDRVRQVEYHNGGVQIVPSPPPPQPAPYSLSIEQIAEQIQGTELKLDVVLDRLDSARDLGGFNLMMAYQPEALSLMTAEEGDAFTQCGWEYFTYRQGANGNCEECPSGLVRVIGIAETNNGPYHPTPDCVLPGSTLTSLHFMLTNEETLECQFVPVRFFWVDCGDNMLTDPLGVQSYVSDQVFDFASGDTAINDGDFGFPTYLGAQDSCLSVSVPGRPHPIRAVDFHNGGVRVICAEPIDCRGDLNLNGIAFELADMVMYARYLCSGLSAFGDHVEGSMAASDVNGDGYALHVSDYLNVAYIAQGVEYPFRDSGGIALDDLVDTIAAFTVTVNQDADGGIITLVAPDTIDVWQLYLVFEGAVAIEDATPSLHSCGQDPTRLGLFERPAGVSTLTYTGEGTLIEAQAAYGRPALYVPTVIDHMTDTPDEPPIGLPIEFALDQNYPNPFNPATTIAFALPIASRVTLDIYNVMGQRVRRLIDANTPAGYHQVLWDGRNGVGESVASGVYFYRISANEFVQCRKMLLLK
jgi:hypothetical protein